MLIPKDNYVKCECGRRATINMIGYLRNNESMYLCDKCATQLARKLLEDLCDSVYKARHG